MLVDSQLDTVANIGTERRIGAVQRTRGGQRNIGALSFSVTRGIGRRLRVGRRHLAAILGDLYQRHDLQVALIGAVGLRAGMTSRQRQGYRPQHEHTRACTHGYLRIAGAVWSKR
ncbi:Uncharacterised protein [Mycobacteroides abscessus subsp. abscessus]|nr:Uncharacterised protein [Mycobacteroides abscessus subsp. abscessus]